MFGMGPELAATVVTAAGADVAGALAAGFTSAAAGADGCSGLPQAVRSAVRASATNKAMSLESFMLKSIVNARRRDRGAAEVALKAKTAATKSGRRCLH